MKAVIDILAKLKEKGILVQLDESSANLRLRGNVAQLAAEERSEIQKEKENIIAFLRNLKRKARAELPPIVPASQLSRSLKIAHNDQSTGIWGAEIQTVSIAQSHAVSWGQRGLWILKQLEIDSSAYNMPRTLRLQGPLDVPAFKRAFWRLVARHETLRTVFRLEEQYEDVRQVVLPVEESNAELRVIDSKAADIDDPDLKRQLEQHSVRPFDLALGPVVRATIFEIGPEEHIFALNIHHIVCDGWSYRVLLKDLGQLYCSESSGVADKLEPLRIQYRDFAAWQRSPQVELALASSRSFWEKHLGGALPLIELQQARPRPAQRSYRSARAIREIRQDLIIPFRESCQQQGATLFMGLFALVNVALHRYSGLEDLILGTPTAGRENPELGNQVGYYVNTLALRTRLAGKDDWQSLLERVRNAILSAFVHQQYPFERVLSDLDIAVLPGRSPVFDVMLVFDEHESLLDSQAFEGLEISELGSRETFNKYDLTFNFLAHNQELHLVLKYDTELYTQEFGERLVDCCLLLMEKLVANPSAPIGKLDIMAEDECKHMLEKFRGPQRPLAPESTALSLFRKAVGHRPRGEAIVAGTVRRTYLEVDTTSNRMARFLLAQEGVNPDSIVGVMLPRNDWGVMTMLGVMKAGLTYLPIDPNYPEGRIALMREDAQCDLLVDEAALAQFFEEMEDLDGTEICLDNHFAPAYVIYTSGSTGRPKGVKIGHRALLNFIQSQQSTYGLGPGERILQLSSFSFDTSIEQVFLALGSGGTLIVAPRELVLDQDAFAELLRLERITHLHSTPTLLKNIKPGSYGGLRRVISGGEPCPWELALPWREYCEFYNKYGPTETTISSTQFNVGENQGHGLVPIGQPVDNTRIYVLNSHQGLNPIGVPGEIYIAGEGVAMGYLHNPSLTEERFVPDLFAPEGGRMYRTGDRGRWISGDAGGAANLEFLGRFDEQVKVRGYRIEPGEVEHLLEEMDTVRSAKVIVDQDGESILAFLVGPGVDLEAAREHLGSRLPQFMLPSRIVPLSQFPISPNGKLDRAALLRMANEAAPISGETAGEGAKQGTSSRSTSTITQTESRLLELFRGLLPGSEVGVTDDFFLSGGHSLTAMQLLTRIRRHWPVKIDIRQIFELRTVGRLAEWISAQEPAEERNGKAVLLSTTERGHHPVSPLQKQIWLADALGKGKVYHIRVNFLLDAGLNHTVFKAALAEMQERHEVLRTVFMEKDGEINQQVILEQEVPLFYVGAEEKAGPDLADLSEGPLWWVKVGGGSGDFHRVEIVFHHIIMDGWSVNLFLRGLAETYQRLMLPPTAPAPKPKATFVEYVNQYLTELTEIEGGMKNYWHSILAAPYDRMDIPSSLARPAAQQFEGAVYSQELPQASMAAFKETIDRAGATLFMGFTAVLNCLLYRYTANRDQVIGVVVSNRREEKYEEVLGVFLNTLPLRTTFEDNATFVDLLGTHRVGIPGMFAHADLPFAQIQEMFPHLQETGRNPVFDIVAVLQNYSTYSSAQPGDGKAGGNPIGEQSQQGSKFDFSFVFEPRGDRHFVHLEYNTSIYAHRDAQMVAMHYSRMLDAVTNHPDRPISQLQYLGEEELAQLVAQFNHRPSPPGTDENLVQLFRRQVQIDPGKTACTISDEKISYADLDSRSDILSHILKQIKHGKS